MKKWIFAAVLALSTMASNTVYAGEGVAIGLKASTLGIGLEVVAPINDYFNARVWGGGFAYSHSRTESGIAYGAKLKLASVGGIVDYHPFEGIFRLSAGVFYDGNKISLTAKPTSGGTFNINGTTYTSAQVGTMTADIDMTGVAPFVGIGWGNAVDEESNWHFDFEIGALYQGTPTATLSSTGAASNPALASSIAAEQAQLRDALSNFKWYPVIASGITYRF